MTTLLNLAENVGNILLEKNLKIVSVESCTGGGLSYWLTAPSGSSAWFERGFVTYSEEAKKTLVNVNANTLNTFGTVSANTAREMAEGGLKNSNAHIAIAITGIAGPLGGSKILPVGTVWFALAKQPLKTITEMHIFSGNREEVREKAIRKAFENILIFLKS